MRSISEQLEWYRQFYNDEAVQIYLADHGEGMENGKAYSIGRTNIPFVVKASMFPLGKEKRLYSHKNFAKIIKAILSEKQEDVNDCFSEYIEYQNIDFYNIKAIETHIFRWMSKKSPVDMANYQARGIRTDEDLYVVYAEGPELYFRLPDEEKNRINDPEWKERIDTLKKMCPMKFIDRRKEPLFKDTYLLYDYLKLIEEIDY